MTISEEFRSAGRLLASLGITANYMGFYYASYAVSLAPHDPERLLFVTKSLYPDVAKHYRTSWKCVERNIRTVTPDLLGEEPRSSLRQAGRPSPGYEARRSDVPRDTDRRYISSPPG